MMTPQEAESRVFSKASFGGGYNMAQVDAFLDTLLSDYSALYKENAALKSKMKVLVDKIEEYRATEDAMRRTLLSAQKMADSMVKEAEAKKTDTIAKAETEAKARIAEINRELHNEETRLTAARNSTTAYVNKLKELYTHELEYIGRLAEMTLAPGETKLEPDPVREIENKVSELLISSQADSEVEAMEQEEADADGDDRPTLTVVDDADEDASEETAASDESDTVVFDRLQFGKDYEFQ